MAVVGLAPIERCIYCGGEGNGEKLSDEHEYNLDEREGE